MLRSSIVCWLVLAATAATRGDTPIIWHSSYPDAVREAQSQRRMLLLHFVHTHPKSAERQFVDQTVVHPEVVSRLQNLVCVRLPLDARPTVDNDRGRGTGGSSMEGPLIQHPAFQYMRGGLGSQ